MSHSSDRIWAPIQIVQEREVSKNRLNGDVIVVKDQPTQAVGVGKAHSLYLHR